LAHQYSVEIQNWLGEQITAAQSEIEAARAGLGEASAQRLDWAQGRLDEAQFFRQMLTQNYDLKTQKYY